jgi:predicted nucleic acid-binding protein
MPADVFLDTNVLVYAYDIDAGEKRVAALRLVERGWVEPGTTAISVQVLQELYVNLMRKGRTHDEAAVILHDLSAWPVVENTLPILHSALKVKARWQTSFWDALILAAARDSGASTLISEDFTHGQDYGGIRVQNPFFANSNP